MKSRTKIVVAGAIALVVAIAAIIGFSLLGGGANRDQTVTWWVPNWDLDSARELVDQFEEEFPDYTVELVETTADTMANRISVALDSGEAPDVITELGSRTRTYIEKGQLSELSGLFDEAMPQDDFISGALEAVSDDDGNVYAVPYRWDAIAMLYNVDMLEEVGVEPPATWAEFEEVAETLTADTDAYGVAWPMNGNPHDLVLRTIGFAISDGATVNNGLPELPRDALANALEIVGGSVAEGWASPSSLEVDNTGVRELFINEQIAMYIGGVFDVVQIEEAGLSVRTLITPGPDGPGTQLADGWVYVIPEEAQNKEGAEELVKFLGRSENMDFLTMTYPGRLSAGENPRFHDELRAPHYAQVSEYSVPPTNDPRWISMLPYVYSEIQSVALGSTTAEESADNIIAELERVTEQ